MKSLKALCRGLLVLATFSAHAAEPDECERRMTYDMASLVELAVERQIITLKTARKLSEAERPFNPLASASARTELQRFKRVFETYTALDEARWKLEREKIAARLEQIAGTQQLRNQARQDTARIMNPQLLFTRPLDTSGAIYTLNTDDGELYYSQVIDGKLVIRTLIGRKEVYVKKLAGKHYLLRLNPDSGDPEVRLMATTDWGIPRGSSKAYFAWTVNLRTGRVSNRDLGWSDPGVSMMLRNWQGAGRSDSAATSYRAANGIVYEAKSSDRVPNKLEIFNQAEPEKILMERDWSTRVKVRFFESGGELYLLSDEVDGPTRLFKPLESNEPLYSVDFTYVRDYHMQVARTPDGQPLLVGFSSLRSQISVFSPFSERR